MSPHKIDQMSQRSKVSTCRSPDLVSMSIGKPDNSEWVTKSPIEPAPQILSGQLKLYTKNIEIFILKPFLIFISKVFLMSWELSCWCPSSGCSAIWRRRWKMAEKFEIISTIISFSTDLHIEDDENFLFVFLWVAQPFLFWHDTIDNVY